jgi:hypothetical protein
MVGGKVFDRTGSVRIEGTGSKSSAPKRLRTRLRSQEETSAV